VTSAAQKVADYLSKPKRLSIGGREVSAQSGETFEVVNPATEAVIATVAKGGAADIDAAVAAARKSFDSGSWRNLPAPQRAGIMQRLAALLLENLEEVALIESNNNGMPIAMARASVMGSASWLNYFAGAVQRIHGKAVQESLSLPGEVLAYTRKEPIGVVGLITPPGAGSRLQHRSQAFGSHPAVGAARCRAGAGSRHSGRRDQHRPGLWR
jgi:acyl-CoA reductase-like NAD-dependent aldehyde dehydrogenase